MKYDLLKNEKLNSFLKEINVTSLLKKFETPFYLYSGNIIKERFEYLDSCIKWNNKKIFYAMKSNYNLNILKLVKSLGGGIDAVSPAEVFLALKAGFPSKDIIFTSNNITDSEMIEVFETGVLFNIDSLSRLQKFGEHYPGSDVCLRFNTDVVAGEHKHIQTGGSKTKFGIQLHEVEDASKIAQKYNLKVAGLHKHTGSGISDKSKYLQSMSNLLSVAEKKYFPDLEFVDFGGGFKAPYHPDEKYIDYKEFGETTFQLFEKFCSDYGRDLKLCIEPGKFLTAESGMLFVKVNTLKENRSRMFAGVNSGFTHLIRPILYDAYHHIKNISNPEGEKKLYDICGNICESGDCFAVDREISEISEGDILVILNAGAYCFSMASVYNLRPLPKEIFIIDEEVSSSKYLSNKEMAEKIFEQY